MGDDRLYGDAGIDLLIGSEGDDTLWGGDDSDALNAGPGRDTLHGEAGGDIVSGGEGNDVLVGGDGPDGYTGGPGDDTLESGKDQDQDLFFFKAGDGHDRIRDFEPDHDILSVLGRTPDQLHYTSDGQGNTLVTWGVPDTDVLLLGVPPDAFT
jgi:Ca2+-binding RTX toxin-like protein